MYVDIDVAGFFSSITHDPMGYSSRSFTTQNKKRKTMFLKSVSNEWNRRRLTERITE